MWASMSMTEEGGLAVACVAFTLRQSAGSNESTRTVLSVQPATTTELRCRPSGTCSSLAPIGMRKRDFDDDVRDAALHRTCTHVPSNVASKQPCKQRCDAVSAERCSKRGRTCAIARHDTSASPSFFSTSSSCPFGLSSK